MNFTQLVLVSLIATCFSAVVINPISGISADNLVYSGTIPISATSSTTMFFTYYGKNGEKTQDNLKNYPLLIFVGSPGSSGQYYSLAGMGPVKLNKDGTLSVNPDTINTFANSMFIDLVGSGFSFAPAADISADYPTYGQYLVNAINQLASESVLGQSSTIVIVGEGSFFRTLAGVSDIDKVKGIVHLSPWPQVYALMKYTGAAGVDMKVFGDSQKIAIETTTITCNNYLRNANYYQARDCYNTILNFVESKTKNQNLYDIRLLSNLTNTLPLVQYYFSQPSKVTAFKAPTTSLFEGQSNLVYNRTFADQAKNYTNNLSRFTKDYLSIKHLFITTDSDYICYRKAVRSWLETELSFVESQAFKDKSLQDIVVDGVTVGYTKAVTQVSYMEILKAGHYVLSDQTKVMATLLKNWVSGLSQQKELQSE